MAHLFFSFSINLSIFSLVFSKQIYYNGLGHAVVAQQVEQRHGKA